MEKYEGTATSVVLPEEVDVKPLSVIGTKAFLSCREVERLILPAGIERIEDWAFAHMKNLRELVLPAKEIAFGRKVFLGCGKLEQISFLQTEGLYRGIPYFLASQVLFTQEPPMDLTLAGSAQGQWKWLAEYDRLLIRFLDREDTDGFEPAFIGWFNIEDVDDQQEDFVRERRRCKISLVLQRFRYDRGLKWETEERLTAYLMAVWTTVAEMLTEEESVYSRDVNYFKIWRKIGGFKVLSPRELLGRLPDGDPEIRAFLMECEMEETGADAFFANLDL
ncbi:MAG: leucine-rich repeat protein [Acetatifactor sp.]